MRINEQELNNFIARALEEDIQDGDHTSLATIPPHVMGKAKLLVKQEGILAGVYIAERIFKKVNNKLSIKINKEDGAYVRKGEIAFIVEGSALSILQAERLVLNIMQRMSGIATITSQYVNKVKGTKAKIIDTRKTTPGIRFLEKAAVILGGGSNHRHGLYDMIMIKDNHVDFCGGIPQAIDAVEKYLLEKKLNLKIEIETRNLEEVNQVLKRGGVHRIMLDNFSVEELKKAINLINGKFETEASGGMNLETIADYAKTGVDYISVGALTHSAVAMDMSLKATIN